MHFYNVISNKINHNFGHREKVNFLAFKISFAKLFRAKFNGASMNIHKSNLSFTLAKNEIHAF